MEEKICTKCGRTFECKDSYICGNCMLNEEGYGNITALSIFVTKNGVLNEKEKY